MGSWVLLSILFVPATDRDGPPAGPDRPPALAEALSAVRNDAVAGEGNTIGLMLYTEDRVDDAVRAAIRVHGGEAVREELVRLLDDPDRFAAAHMALQSAFKVGPIFGGARHAGVPRPASLEERLKLRTFYFGLEYRLKPTRKIIPTFPNHPEQAERLTRYWREHWAGERYSFAVRLDP